MAKSGPRKTNRYSDEFKATAVRLSDLPDVLIQDVAEALDIHPFMLSRWRKLAREGLIVTKDAKLDLETASELKRLRDLEKKYKLLPEEHALLKSHPVCFRSKTEIFEFIEANRETHQVAMMCRVYGVTRAGFYAWRSRGLSLRAQENAALVQQITQVHQASRCLYGSPRIHHELKTSGV